MSQEIYFLADENNGARSERPTSRVFSPLATNKTCTFFKGGLKALLYKAYKMCKLGVYRACTNNHFWRGLLDMHTDAKALGSQPLNQETPPESYKPLYGGL